MVISTLAFSAALLVPVNESKRDKALSAICKSRQNETGVALQMYATDWRGALPRAHWDTTMPDEAYTRLPYKLAPYLGQEPSGGSAELWGNNIYHCPAQAEWLDSYGLKVKRGTSSFGSYGYNYFFFYGLNPGGRFHNRSDWVERKIAEIKMPENLPLYGCVNGDSYEGIGGGGGQILAYSGPHPKAIDYGFMGGILNGASVSKTHRSGPAPNHNGNCNMLMGDFHVEAVNVCVDGEFPWQDYNGTAFHPSRASSRGAEKR